MSVDKAQALNAAKQYVLQRNVKAAVDIYQEIIKDDPSDLSVSSTLGDLYVSAGQVPDAIAQLSRVADAYIEQGLARKAITTLKKILAVDPSNIETAIKLADLYAQAGLPSEARQHYLQIADALYRKGSTLDALSVFRKLVQLDPSNTSTRIKLGELYLREGMNEQGYEAFMTAAEQLTSKLEYRRALNAYNEALAIKPDSSDAQEAAHKLMTLLGIPEPEKGPLNQSSQPEVSGVLAAEKPSRPAASSDSSTPADRTPGSESFVIQEISKAEILVAYGKVNQAVSMLRQVLESNPDSIDVHIKLKDIYLRTGMMMEAAHECSALERIFEARGDSDRARDYAVRASRLTQLLEQPSGDLAQPMRKPAEEGGPRLSSTPIVMAPQPQAAPKPGTVLSTLSPKAVPQQNRPLPGPIVNTAPLTAPPRPDTSPKPRPVINAAPMDVDPQQDRTPKPRPVINAAPMDVDPQQDRTPKPRPVISESPMDVDPQQDRTPKPRPVINAASIDVAPRQDRTPKPRPVISASPLDVAPRQDKTPKPRTVINASPLDAAPRQDKAPKSPTAVSEIAVEVAPQYSTAPKPGPLLSETNADTSQPALVTSTLDPSTPAAVELPKRSDAGSPPGSPSQTVESPAEVADPMFSVSPANPPALVQVSDEAPSGQENRLPMLFADSSAAKERGRLAAAGIAAGVFVLLGVSAVVGAFAYDAHLDTEYAALSLAAPPLAEPLAPPAVQEGAKTTQANESITVVATTSQQNDAAVQRQNTDPKAAKAEHPAQFQTANQSAKIKVPFLLTPPRAVASPDVRAGNETRTPAGIPEAVPLAPHATEPPPKAVRQSPGVVVGGAIKKVDPGYPAAAKQAGQAGSVAVEVTISEQGNVTSARALSGPVLLRNAAVTAARAWKFRASTLGGIPVTTTTTIVFNFKL